MFYTVATVLSFACEFIAAQAQRGEAPPPPARVASPAVISPEVAADRRVTFRLYAPNASAVTVNGEWSGGNNLAMTKDARAFGRSPLGRLRLKPTSTASMWTVREWTIQRILEGMSCLCLAPNPRRTRSRTFRTATFGKSGIRRRR